MKPVGPMEKTKKADIDDEYRLQMEVVSQEEIRERLAHDKESQYASLELDPKKLLQQPGENGRRRRTPRYAGMPRYGSA